MKNTDIQYVVHIVNMHDINSHIEIVLEKKVAGSSSSYMCFNRWGLEEFSPHKFTKAWNEHIRHPYAGSNTRYRFNRDRYFECFDTHEQFSFSYSQDIGATLIQDWEAYIKQNPANIMSTNCAEASLYFLDTLLPEVLRD